MTSYYASIEVPEGEINAIMDELTAAQKKIYECYDRLRDLGVVKFVPAEKSEATSSN